MSAKSFVFTFQVADGSILKKPEILLVRCDLLIPIGMNIITGVDDQECIVRMRVLQFSYHGRMLGTKQFKSLAEYNEFKAVACQCCPEHSCPILFGGCKIEYDDCTLIYNIS